MVGCSRYVKLKEVREMRKFDWGVFTFILGNIAVIIAAFCLGMFIMWGWLNPAESEVWNDGVFYYVETPDGNIWMHDMDKEEI